MPGVTQPTSGGAREKTEPSVAQVFPPSRSSRVPPRTQELPRIHEGLPSPRPGADALGSELASCLPAQGRPSVGETHARPWLLTAGVTDLQPFITQSYSPRHRARGGHRRLPAPWAAIGTRVLPATLHLPASHHPLGAAPLLPRGSAFWNLPARGAPFPSEETPSTPDSLCPTAISFLEPGARESPAQTLLGAKTTLAGCAGQGQSCACCCTWPGRCHRGLLRKMEAAGGTRGTTFISISDSRPFRVVFLFAQCWE